MRARWLRSIVLVLVLGAVSASAWTLLADSTLTAPRTSGGSPSTSASVAEARSAGGDAGFQPCPYPPCMAPCQFPPQPEVLCQTGDGVTVTSFTCCCCGGGSASFRPL